MRTGSTSQSSPSFLHSHIPALFTPVLSATSRQQHGSQVRDRGQLEVQRLRGVGGGLGESKGLHPMPLFLETFLSPQQPPNAVCKHCLLLLWRYVRQRGLDHAGAWRHSDHTSRVDCAIGSICVCSRSLIVRVDHAGWSLALSRQLLVLYECVLV